MKLLKTRIALAVGLLSAGSVALGAAQETTTFTVTAEVVDACEVSANNLAFGSYNPVEGGNLDGTSTIDVTCSNGTDYQIGLSGGDAGDVENRTMSDGTNSLDYQLFSDSGRTTNWGTTEDADTLNDGTTIGDGTQNSHIVYGRILDQPTAVVSAGYTDTVTVTMYY